MAWHTWEIRLFTDLGRIVVIPDHGSQVIVRPLLRKILRDLGLSVEEYTRFLEEQ